MTRSRSLGALLAVGMVQSLGGQASGPSPAIAARIARIEADIRAAPRYQGSPVTTIEGRMRALRIPAVSIAVVDSGRIVWAKAYGVADAATRQPITTESRFQAASMSKPVASFGALRLVEAGKLTLDGDVNTTLRGWKIPSNAFNESTPVTLRMLLNHTAGLTVHGFLGYTAGLPIPTVPQLLDGAPPANSAAVRVDTTPGTRWRYSGGGMTVAQLLMTSATNEPFPALMRRLVLGPMQMTSSSYEQPLPDSVAPFAATGHRANGTAVTGRWHSYPEMMAAGLWTTPSDLGRYVMEVQRAQAGKSKLLTQATARSMLTAGRGGWGLGVQLVGAGDSLRFMHGGVNEGFQGAFVGYVGSGRGVVVMTNSDAGMTIANEIIDAVGREYDWPGLRSRNERVEIALDSAQLGRFVGTYRLDANVTIKIAQLGNRLTAQATGQAPFPIFAERAERFFAKVADIQIEFEVGADGAVVALRLLQGGAVYRAVR